MRLVLVYAAAAGLAVAAAAVSATEVSLRCAAVAFGVLAWRAAAGARGAARRVRWPLAAGCVLFAAAALVRHSALPDGSQDLGWFGYGPPGTAQLVAWRDVTCRLLGWELVAAGVQCVAVVLFAAAVHGLPRARRRRRTVATVAAAVALAAVIVADRWAGGDADELVPWVRGVWPGLLAVAAGLALLVLAGRRSDHRRLVAAGAALVAVQVVVTLSDATGLWSTASSLTDLIRSDAHTALAVSTAVSDGPELWPALATAVALCGPALLVAGALRAAPPPEV